MCHTKIDDVTKECKRKHDKGCMSDPGEIKCLATVTIADSSGSCDNIGIEGECLLTFTKCETIDDLLKKIETGATLSMLLRADIRMGANNASVELEEVKFNIIKVVPFILRNYENVDEWRPNALKVTRLDSEPDDGAIVSISMPSVVVGNLPVQMYINSIPCSKVPPILTLHFT